MSMRHEGSRADYITSLALARSHAEIHGRPFSFHSHPTWNHRHDNTRASKDMPKHLQSSAIPDLRFEPTYLAKLSTAGSDWQSVAWITVRDHAISPLLQGVLWGTASVFIQPLLRSLMWWRYPRDISQPQKEGSVAGWLRQWARSLFPQSRIESSSGIR